MSEPLDHLLDIASLDDGQLRALLERSAEIKMHPERFSARHAGRMLINLFYEPSTRTRVSFEIAAKRLGLDVVNFSTVTSSVVKGEILADSFQTLAAMGPDVVVVRHSEDGAPSQLADIAPPGVHVVNAGDGCRAHPTQALLDAFTLSQHFGRFADLRVVIAGDLHHSRVTRSNVEILRRLGVAEIRLAAPQALLPDSKTAVGTELHDDLDAAVEGADVVMMLRIQHERLEDIELPDAAQYHRHWGLTAERLRRAAPGCKVMHPGPMNRGVEIAGEVADGPQSLILDQVRNGVFMRMAIIMLLLEGPEIKSGDAI